VRKNIEALRASARKNQKDPAQKYQSVAQKSSSKI
jgi:hypothetical protein